MKNRILTTILSMCCVLPFATAGAQQNSGNSISVSGTEVVLTDDNSVSVAFKLHVGEGVVEKNRSIVIRPALKGVDGQSELPVVIVRGARARIVDENRAMIAAGVNSEGRYVTANNAVLDYYAKIPRQEWMIGSQLVLSGINAGRGTATEVNIGVVANDLLLGAPVETAPPPVVPPVVEKNAVLSNGSATVGDELAARFTFVEPVEKYNLALSTTSIDALFDYNMPLVFGTATTKSDDEVSRFVEMTRQGALYIEFDRGSDMVGRELGSNNRMLVDLISSIRVLDAAQTVKIVRVVVVGFSAPEGSADETETLALERAGVVRDFMTANSRLDPEVIDTYNGSVDWVTLRTLVAESNMSDKYKVLDIIDNVPAWGSTQGKGRMAYLTELGNGTVFRYIRENFFPKLRQTGAYVKIYYENVQ
jgi:hypothetical protein